MIKFIAIDSSLANTGLAYGTIDENNNITVEGIDLHTTEKTKNKQVRASSDTIDRCKSTYTFIKHFIGHVTPDIIFVETPSGSQNSSAMKSYGATCQLIASLKPSPIEVTPTEVKVASFGSKTASKADMIQWATNKYPDLDWPLTTRKGITKITAKAEHMADAIAIAHAGILTSEFERISRFIQ